MTAISLRDSPPPVKQPRPDGIGTAGSPPRVSPPGAAGAEGGRSGAERPPRQYVNNSTAAGQGTEALARLRRRDRLVLRAKIRRFSRLKSVPRFDAAAGKMRRAQYTLRKCGVTPCGKSGFVRLKAVDGVGYAEGVVHCGSVHSCPVCAAKIRTRRAEVYSVSAARWLEAGNSLYTIALTFPHYMGMELSPMWDLVSGGAGYLTSNARWDKLKDALGCRRQRVFQVSSSGEAVVLKCPDIGYRRVVECTWGCENGWHPHCHMLVYLRGEDSARRLFLIDQHFRTQWNKWVTGRGFSLPSHERGVKVEPCHFGGDAAGYLVKTQDGKGVGQELARGDLKKGRKDSLTPFEVADRAGDGEAEFLKLWWEWEQASKGRRMVTNSRGLPLLLGETDLTDQEIADEEAGGDAVAELAANTWAGVCRHRCEDGEHGAAAVRNGLEADILEVVAAGGLAAVNEVLSVHGCRLAWVPAAAADRGG